jgi:hypothetical protein
MRVRLRLDPNQRWYVEFKSWFYFEWHCHESFGGDNAYKRAKDYALKLKHQQIEEIT